MINLKQLTNQLELSFWSYTIRLLSESKALRRILPTLYMFSHLYKFQPFLRIAMVCSLTGFLVGLVVGVLSIY